MSSPIIHLVKPASRKMLLVLQFWEGDKAQAMALARLLADLEPAHSSLADFLFVHRFDCEPDAESVKHVSRKFNVLTHRSTRRSTGWPRGCNGLFFGGLEYLYHMSAENPKTPRYKAAFFMEADCCPLHRAWLPWLNAKWDAFNGSAYVAGVKVEGPTVAEHINGNCIMSGNLKFLNWLVKSVGEPPNVGWDYALAGEFRRWGAAEIKGMQFHWKAPTMSEDDLTLLKADGAVWLHGIKDFSALEYARKTLLT
jgi:hypothetical protein